MGPRRTDDGVPCCRSRRVAVSPHVTCASEGHTGAANERCRNFAARAVAGSWFVRSSDCGCSTTSIDRVLPADGSAGDRLPENEQARARAVNPRSSLRDRRKGKRATRPNAFRRVPCIPRIPRSGPLGLLRHRSGRSGLRSRQYWTSATCVAKTPVWQQNSAGATGAADLAALSDLREKPAQLLPKHPDIDVEHQHRLRRDRHRCRTVQPDASPHRRSRCRLMRCVFGTSSPGPRILFQPWIR